MSGRCDVTNQVISEAELLAALDRLDEHWTSMSAVRVRALLQADGFTVSEKRAKSLKSRRVAAADASNSNELPTSSQPTRSTKLHTQCAYCAVADATKICTRCMTARYCSSECQHAHWKQHKPDCKKKDQFPPCFHFPLVYTSFPPQLPTCFWAGNSASILLRAVLGVYMGPEIEGKPLRGQLRSTPTPRPAQGSGFN